MNLNFGNSYNGQKSSGVVVAVVQFWLLLVVWMLSGCGTGVNSNEGGTALKLEKTWHREILGGGLNLFELLIVKKHHQDLLSTFTISEKTSVLNSYVRFFLALNLYKTCCCWHWGFSDWAGLVHRIQTFSFSAKICIGLCAVFSFRRHQVDRRRRRRRRRRISSGCSYFKPEAASFRFTSCTTCRWTRPAATPSYRWLRKTRTAFASADSRTTPSAAPSRCAGERSSGCRTRYLRPGARSGTSRSSSCCCCCSASSATPSAARPSSRRRQGRSRVDFRRRRRTTTERSLSVAAASGGWIPRSCWVCRKRCRRRRSWWWRRRF